MSVKEQTSTQKRVRAYDLALRVLSKRHKEEFKAIYARILQEEYNLKPQGQARANIEKYV